MFNEIRKIWVFVKRDFRVMFTYKLVYLTAFLSILFNFFYMVLFGSMFQSGVIPALDAYGGDFISYILVGSIGWGLMWNVMNGTAISLRTEMELGTLESILLTPTSIYTMVIAYTLFSAFFGVLSIIILVVAGFVLFGIVIFSTMSIFTIVFFLLSTIMMTGFGMILGGLTVWIKNIGETAPLIQTIAMFFSGVYFPIAVLPGSLQTIAKFVPFYYYIEGFRLSLIPTTPVSELLGYTTIFLALAVIFIFLGAYALHKGLIKAKKDGSLAFY
jgi:ABC-2 type transport system permease protein